MKHNGMQKMTVKISGISGLLFDRFVDMSADRRPPEEKLYLNGNKELVLPSENIYAFLFGENPRGCAMRFEAKKGKDYRQVGMAALVVSPEFIPFTRNGKPIVFSRFVDGRDEKAGLHVLHHKANVKKGMLVIPSPKERPMLATPWDLQFDIDILENHLVTPEKIKNWFMRGGIEIALGTYRPRFGRFQVSVAERD